jgi:hypothetical protein
VERAIRCASSCQGSATASAFQQARRRYELVGDFWGMGNKPQEMLKQLTPRYAYHATMAKLSEQGFTLASEEREPNGRVRLLLRRVG